MRRGALLVASALLLAAVAVLWRCDRRSDDSHDTSSSLATKPHLRTRSTEEAKKLPRGTITGVVVDERKQPLAGANVCATGRNDTLDPALLREPTCITSDASGRSTIENLLPAEYTVGAGARGFRPGTTQTRVDASTAQVELVLRGGGVETKQLTFSLESFVTASWIIRAVSPPPDYACS